MKISELIAAELSVRPAQVAAAASLLEEGATVPFIARYRKERTGGLDDTQLRRLEERLVYLKDLEERRGAVLRAIEEQGKLNSALEAQIRAADTKTRLEDLYLPYKKKRRTKAQIAREAGLEPLADAILEDPGKDPANLASAHVAPERGVDDAATALEGARQILMERFAEDPTLVGELRELLWNQAHLRSRVIAGKEAIGAKFADYFDYIEPLRKVPSHRALALLRGRRDRVLSLAFTLPEDEREDRDSSAPGTPERRIAARFGIQHRDRRGDEWLRETIRFAWRVKLATHLESDLLTRLRDAAEAEAIKVFARNLHDLMLAAPAGQRATMGLDPGLRTGVKVAVVDGTGKLVTTATIYPHPPHKQWDSAIATMAKLAAQYGVELVSIGNGTGSRETDRLVADLSRRHPELRLTRVVVSEAGASVYSASELASREFPHVDVSLRGAVSIARRLQDPLAELVKIDPKAIGVGQYQHDVNQVRLAGTLDAVVEDCVNAVGVDVNTASGELLARVSGVGPALAANIVSYRDERGAFMNRRELKKVPRLGQKAFEQAAGFLRVNNGDNPLDASAVHPEAYSVVVRMEKATGRPVESLVGDGRFLRSLTPSDFIDDVFGEPTVRDILAELEKPGRDPRPDFHTATFREGVESLGDLEPDMIMEGVVTNVTNFGAFVDIGVHQDGLVHISALADRFVKDPRDVVRTGQLVKVKVLSVDAARRRIALTMRLQDESRAVGPESGKGKGQNPAKRRPENRTPHGGAMADAFARLKRRDKPV